VANKKQQATSMNGCLAIRGSMGNNHIAVLFQGLIATISRSACMRSRWPSVLLTLADRLCTWHARPKPRQPQSNPRAGRSSDSPQGFDECPVHRRWPSARVVNTSAAQVQAHSKRRASPSSAWMRRRCRRATSRWFQPSHSVVKKSHVPAVARPAPRTARASDASSTR
jgi:hypothetical protein